jgi:ABC-type multidrug transport system fused ATPase/permease subunit
MTIEAATATPPASHSPAARGSVRPIDLARHMLCTPFYIMLTLMVVEALLSAVTTYLVIEAGRGFANNQLLVRDLLLILGAQSASYVVGAISWIYAERAGFLAYGRYILQFAHENRHQTQSLTDKEVRERVEPFLTGETFYVYFNLLFEIEGDLRLLLALIFNVIVLGTQIDGSLPVAYAAAFVVLFLMQWTMRKQISRAYLDNQRMTNRMTAQGYTAWDNIFTGNRYNLRLWIAGFKTKLRDGLKAQIKAIMTKEGLSAASAIVGLAIVFFTMAYVAASHAGDPSTLIALIATLPRQIEMTHNMHQFTSGWNELLAVWTRLRGVASNTHPEFDQGFDARIKLDRLVLREGDAAHTVGSLEDAFGLILAKPTGRINVRGANGSGKSTLLTSLKAQVKNRAYYWPTADRLAFQFMQGQEPEDMDYGDEDEPRKPSKPPGFSSGERQLRALREIVAHTAADMYLLDEWDANLDPSNRAAADALVEQLASRARVVEISHRDRV